MASVREVWNGIQAALTSEFALPLRPTPVPVIFIDEPSNQQLAQETKCGDASQPLISIFDTKESVKTTRWMPFRQSQVQPVTGITTTVSGKILAVSGTQTITIAGSILVNDAISAVVSNGLNTQAAVAKATNLDTTTTLATKLAAAVNANSLMNTLVSATSTGAVVTITNLSPLSFAFHSKVGNVGVLKMQYGTAKRLIMVTVYANSPDARDMYGQVVMNWAAKYESRYGIQLANGEWIKIEFSGDLPGKDLRMQDLFRWDLALTVEHAITYEELIYTVIATIPHYTIGP